MQSLQGRLACNMWEKQTRVVMDSKVNAESTRKLIKLMNALSYPPNLLSKYKGIATPQLWVQPSEGWELVVANQYEVQHVGTQVSFKCVTLGKCICAHLPARLQDYCLADGLWASLLVAIWPPVVLRPQNFMLQLKETILFECVHHWAQSGKAELETVVQVEDLPISQPVFIAGFFHASPAKLTSS